MTNDMRTFQSEGLTGFIWFDADTAPTFYHDEAIDVESLTRQSEKFVVEAMLYNKHQSLTIYFVDGKHQFFLSRINHEDPSVRLELVSNEHFTSAEIGLTYSNRKDMLEPGFEEEVLEGTYLKKLV